MTWKFASVLISEEECSALIKTMFEKGDEDWWNKEAYYLLPPFLGRIPPDRDPFSQGLYF